MRNRQLEIVDMAPTPATQGGPVPNVPLPDGALISDDDDSFISRDTESEGDFDGDDNANDYDGDLSTGFEYASLGYCSGDGYCTATASAFPAACCGVSE